MRYVKEKLIIFTVILVTLIISGCSKSKLELEFENETYEYTVGQRAIIAPQLIGNKLPSEIKFNYTSTNETVATYVDGMLEALQVGTTTIRATLDYKDEVFAEAIVTVIASDNQKFTITYHLNGGKNDENAFTEFTKDDLGKALPNPSKDGYKFLGWFANSDYTGAKITFLELADNLTLYAKWEQEHSNYTISYNLNGGTNHSSNLVDVNASNFPITLQAPKREGYTFLGWYLNPDFSGNPYTELTVASDYTLFAKWELIDNTEYTIGYILNGGNNNPLNKHKFFASQLPITLLAPTKTGYLFKGWYSDPNFTIKSNVTITEKGHYTFYAKWEEVEEDIFTIDYELNGGIQNPLNVFNFTNSNLPITLHNPSREGFEFIGWYTSSTLTGDVVTQLTTAKNYKLYAKWIKKTEQHYRINYNINGATNHPSNLAVLTKDDFPFTLNNPTREGYKFLGWYTNTIFSGERVTTLIEAKNYSLYPKWEIKKYNLTFILNDGINNHNNKDSFTYHDLPLKLNDPTKEGFIFMGWYTNSLLQGNPISTITELKDTTVYARWQEVKVEIDPATIAAIERAEQSRFKEDYERAVNLVNLIEDEPTRLLLIERLNEIDIIKEDVIIDDSTIGKS